MNPYEILEISRNATDEEIKKAYRELAKKYHPDNFKDNPLAELAEEKMKNINQAYDLIQKERSGNGGNNNYNNGDYSNGSNFIKVRELINNKRFSEAEILLDNTAGTLRNAEWYYLKGVLQAERGWYFDAQKSFQTACNIDPQNAEYADALYSIKSRSNNYYNNSGYNQPNNNGANCSFCDMCAGFMCADCLCDMMRC